MSLTVQNGAPVHMPNGSSFAFDAEVAEIFPDMARRSIPLFYETHALHAGICAPWMKAETVDVLDVGTSRGAFIQALKDKYDILRPGILLHACDYSPEMCEHVKAEFPYVNVYEANLADDSFYFDHSPESFDIINCTYVIQFVDRDWQVRALRKLVSMLKPGGLLFLGQKLAADGPAGRLLNAEYIKWRLSNGYTQEEIDAKTAALKNSMWPMPEKTLVDYLNKFGLDVVETSRFGVFNNYMCTKGL